MSCAEILFSRKTVRQLEQVQGIATTMIRGLENMTYEEKSEDIELFGFKKGDD